jgi:hypothetical protein
MSTALAKAIDLDYHRLSTVRAEMERLIRSIDLAILSGDGAEARTVAKRLRYLAGVTEGAASSPR